MGYSYSPSMDENVKQSLLHTQQFVRPVSHHTFIIIDSKIKEIVGMKNKKYSKKDDLTIQKIKALVIHLFLTDDNEHTAQISLTN